MWLPSRLIFCDEMIGHMKKGLRIYPDPIYYTLKWLGFIMSKQSTGSLICSNSWTGVWDAMRGKPVFTMSYKAGVVVQWLPTLFLITGLLVRTHSLVCFIIILTSWVPCSCLFWFSLNNMHKGGEKQHYFYFILRWAPFQCTSCGASHNVHQEEQARDKPLFAVSYMS